MSTADLANRFTYHSPGEDADPFEAEKLRDLYSEIRNGGFHFANYIDTFTPDSREKSLAITKIEEAVFWANAAIARNS